MIAFARSLVATPSQSGGEQDAATLCREELERRGFDVETDELGNVVGMRGLRGPLLLFDAHVDTVAPTDAWTRDPFAPDIEDGRLYGLGATDMKGPIAALVEGLARAKPPGRIAVSITTLEETAEGATLAAVCDRLAPTGVVIAEPSRRAVMVAQKGRAELTVNVRGRGAHAAFPDRGRSALRDAARFVIAIEERAPATDPQLGPAVTVATEAITSPLPGISVVPSHCRLRLDRRLLPDEREEDVLAEVRDVLARADVEADVHITSTPVRTYTGATIEHRRFLPAWRVSAEQPLARAALRAVGGGRDAYRFCTNGSLTASRGIPTVGYGPGDPEMAHRPDEWIAIKELEAAAAGYTALAEMTDWRGCA
ncbi:MAG: hypothetical protein QOJ13_2770 [Gaiellales bacterium]|jgi:putative selenium metabolism hydrolase|nr:hypothetical protein [Gaiellales bacterium]